MSKDKKVKDEIYIYDVFTDLYGDDVLRLYPNPLYMYCFLYKNRSHEYITKISVEIIHQSMPIKFYPSLDYKNRSMIKDTLLSLKEKGIISFDDSDKLNGRSGNGISLNIIFNKFTESKGHLRMEYTEFETFYEIDYFYITCAVRRYEKVKSASMLGGRWISEKEFGMLLGKSRKTFQFYAKDMIEKGLLYKLSGKRFEGSKEQDKNIYKTVPFATIIEKVKSKDELEDKKIEPDKYIIPEGIPDWYNCEESSSKGDKRFSVKDLRDTILSSGNIYTEHYFYAYEFEKIDPVVYEAYMLSRKRLEKSKKFDFSKIDELWRKRMEKIENRNKEKNREIVISKMIEDNEHVINLNKNEFCTADKVKDWNKVTGFMMKDTSYTFKRGEDFSEFAINIIKERKVLNIEVYDEIKNGWKKHLEENE